MNKTKKILLISGLLVVITGGYAITQWLVKRVTKIRGGVAIKQDYTEATDTQPLTE